jgi:hypothetical protein
MFRLLGLCAFGLTATLCAQTPKIDFPAPSPTATLKQRVGLTDIEITYSRPGAKGRQVFGNVVPYGQVWRTGANNATKITFSTDANFGGAAIPAGSYALFTIPAKDDWTIILNKVTGQWGAYTYDEKNDVVRVNAKATSLSRTVETFTIDVNDIRDESATLNLTWENTRVSIPFKLEVVTTLVPKIEAALADAQNVPVRLYDGAAMFYLENNLDLNKASQWMDAAIAQQPQSYFLYYHKARILAKRGDKAGALSAAQKSMELAANDSSPAKGEYTRLNQSLISSLGQ